ncbi:hypothetical protein MFRU_004g03730 [Monilinia fructicola]|nr:hypothetical protein MFRU_004g03730 [Monilinia fructicola]
MAAAPPSNPHLPSNPHTLDSVGPLGTPPKEMQLLSCTKADLYNIALLEHLAFEHDEFSDLALGRERGSEESLGVRMKQFAKFLEQGEQSQRVGEGVLAGGWYTKAVVWEGGKEVMVGVAGWSLGSGKTVGEGEREVDSVPDVSEVSKVKTREELDEIWGKGSNAQLCEDVFVRGDEYISEACGDRPWLKLNILVVHPKYQRLGIGTRLLEQGIQFADAKGLQTVLGASPWGIGLYRKYGFVDVHVMDIRLDEYEGGEGMGRTSHVIMRRQSRVEVEEKNGTGTGVEPCGI